MITFLCPDCGEKLTIKDEHAGKNAACPRCKQRVQVPAAVPAPELTGIDNATLPLAGNAPVSSLAGQQGLDFLGPPQGPGELGRLGQYRVVKVLGEGGMGMVLLAEDPLAKRSVALKVMRPELAARDDARQRFLREAQATASIEHPHIVALYQVSEDRGVPFLAMPFLKGEPLDERLKREKKLPVAEVVHLGRQIAEGLAAAHQQGLIHRDIKPANIWLQPHGGAGGAPPRPWVKILDFDLARAAEDNGQLTKSGMIVGTPAYMPPEQARGEKVDARCDLFSLGAVLYRMLTGEQPFKGSDPLSLLMALATEEPRAVRELRPETPAALADLVKLLLAKDPDRRPAAARAVAEALAEIEADGLSMPPPDADKIAPAKRSKSAVKRRAKARPRWLLPAAGGGVLLTLLVLVIGIFGPFGGAKAPKGDSPGLLVANEGGKGAKGAAKREEVVKDGDKGAKEPKRVEGEPSWGKEIENSIGMKLVRIPAGNFPMGSPPDEKGRFPGETQHEVEITKAFYMGVTTVTQKQFKDMMGYNPSYFSKDGKGRPGLAYTGSRPASGHNRVPADTSRFPVENVSWEEAKEFCEELSAQPKEKEAGREYRLPTEAEWEYACRAGAKTRFHSGDDEDDLKKMGWYNANSNGRPHEVGTKKANAWGLYDMHGNVWQWCSDRFDKDYYQNSPKKDPKGPYSGRSHVLHGGYWNDDPRCCRAAFRFGGAAGDPNLGCGGFRVACGAARTR